MLASNGLKNASVGIDLVRGLAALAVAASHLRGLSLLDYGSLPIDQRNIFSLVFYAATRLGHEAVIVFFVLSGYLVGGGSIVAASIGNFSGKNYLIDRVTRVFVPLVGAVALTVCVILLHHEPTPPAMQVLTNMVALNGIFLPTLKFNSALWTLTYEAYFYWILLVSILLVIRRNESKKFTLCIAALIFISLIYVPVGFEYLFIWCLGVFSFLTRDALARYRYLAIGAACFIAGLMLYQLQTKSNAFDAGIEVGAVYAEMLLGFGAAIALPRLSQFEAIGAFKWLATIASFLAGISYSLYLTHLPVIGLFELLDPRRVDLGSTNLLFLALKLTVVVGFAWIFSRIFERGSFRMRRRLKAMVHR